MAQFELDIGSDIPVPLDKPTGYGLPYNTAKSYVNETISNIDETIDIIRKNRMTRMMIIAMMIFYHQKVKYGLEQFRELSILIWYGIPPHS